MNRSFVLYSVGVFLLGVQAFLSCSSPLDDAGGLNTSPPDTIVITDTVIIVEIDTTTAKFCGDLSGSRDEIEWHINNNAGRFILEFVASSESGELPQLLEVEIGKQEFKWDLSESLEFSLELDLKRNIEIEVELEGHDSFGHTIEICLTVRTE